MDQKIFHLSNNYTASPVQASVQFTAKSKIHCKISFLNQNEAFHLLNPRFIKEVLAPCCFLSDLALDTL